MYFCGVNMQKEIILDPVFCFFQPKGFLFYLNFIFHTQLNNTFFVNLQLTTG